MTIDIVKTFDLIDYDSNMWLLYADLKHLLENDLKNQSEFDANQRLVFLHQDLDFFINNDFPGFTLYNLQLILQKLNISNFFCAVVSNIPNYSKYTNLVKNLLAWSDIPLRGITSLYGTCIHEKTKIKPIQLNTQTIDYPFICLNRLSRIHRNFFVAKLFEKNLQNKGLLSYHNIDAQQDTTKKQISLQSLNVDNNCKFSFLNTAPFTRYNSIMQLFQPNNIELVNHFSNNIPKFCNFQESDAVVSDKGLSMHYQNSSIQQALVYIGVETTPIYPEPFLSRISFKGIVDKRPFILMACPGTLLHLKSLGFKTFDCWWDESYDQEKDFETRTEMIVSIVDCISNYSTRQLRQMCIDMEHILEHNFYHFTVNFLSQEKEKISKILEIQTI
jgi:hypothetical protein